MQDGGKFPGEGSEHLPTSTLALETVSRSFLNRVVQRLPFYECHLVSTQKINSRRTVHRLTDQEIVAVVSDRSGLER